MFCVIGEVALLDRLFGLCGVHFRRFVALESYGVVPDVSVLCGRFLWFERSDSSSFLEVSFEKLSMRISSFGVRDLLKE